VQLAVSLLFQMRETSARKEITNEHLQCETLNCCPFYFSLLAIRHHPPTHNVLSHISSGSQ